MKSPEELDITQEELDALLKVRGMLAQGKLKHREDLYRTDYDGNHAGVFHMEHTCIRFSCGTVGCIGGWMRIFASGIKPVRGVYDVGASSDITHYVCDAENTRPIGKLFFPPRRFKYSAITDANALQAIDNFLHTGKPAWETILTVEKEDYNDDDFDDEDDDD